MTRDSIKQQSDALSCHVMARRDSTQQARAITYEQTYSILQYEHTVLYQERKEVCEPTTSINFDLSGDTQ